MQLQNEIQKYVMEELTKGFQFPVTGPLKGTVIKRILRKMDYQQKISFYNETGRVMVGILYDYSTTNLDILRFS